MQGFQAWLEALDQELSLNGTLVLDAEQRCFLLFDDTLLVEIAYNPAAQVFRFQSDLSEASEKKKQNLEYFLLQVNLGWKNTNGASFGIQPYSEKVQLLQTIPMATCNYEKFHQELETFVNTFEYWKEHWKDFKLSPSSEKQEKFDHFFV